MTSLLGELPDQEPALRRALIISQRAAAVGFDWSCLADIRAKISEELAELDAALKDSQQRNSAHVTEEFGDLLVALVNLSRHLALDPEAALCAATEKFARRFQYMESEARARGLVLQSLSGAQWDALWTAAKRAVLLP